MNIADCLQKLNEKVKKLTNKFEELERSRKEFEKSVLESLSTIDSNWKQLQSKYFLLHDNGEYSSLHPCY